MLSMKDVIKTFINNGFKVRERDQNNIEVIKIINNKEYHHIIPNESIKKCKCQDDIEDLVQYYLQKSEHMAKNNIN